MLILVSEVFVASQYKIHTDYLCCQCWHYRSLLWYSWLCLADYQLRSYCKLFSMSIYPLFHVWSVWCQDWWFWEWEPSLDQISVVFNPSFDYLFSFVRQLTLRWVMDEAKKSTKSGSLKELSMVLLNNLLSLPFAITLILLSGEWHYVIHAWVNVFLFFRIQSSLLPPHHCFPLDFQRRH